MVEGGRKRLNLIIYYRSNTSFGHPTAVRSTGPVHRREWSNIPIEETSHDSMQRGICIDSWMGERFYTGIYFKIKWVICCTHRIAYINSDILILQNDSSVTWAALVIELCASHRTAAQRDPETCKLISTRIYLSLLTHSGWVIWNSPFRYGICVKCFYRLIDFLISFHKSSTYLSTRLNNSLFYLLKWDDGFPSIQVILCIVWECCSVIVFGIAYTEKTLLKKHNLVWFCAIFYDRGYK